MNVRQPGFFLSKRKNQSREEETVFCTYWKTHVAFFFTQKYSAALSSIAVCFNAYQAEPKQIYDLPSSELMDSNLGLAATQLLGKLRQSHA